MKLFFREYTKEPILNPPISNPDKKTKNPIGTTDLRHQAYHITFKRIQLIQQHGTDPDNARLFLILINRREVELISDGSKLIEVKVI